MKKINIRPRVCEHNGYCSDVAPSRIQLDIKGRPIIIDGEIPEEELEPLSIRLEGSCPLGALKVE